MFGVRPCLSRQRQRAAVPTAPDLLSSPATIVTIDPPAAGAPRVALYSHDAMGLGHVRRNLAIADTLAHEGASVLLVAGTPEVRSFTAPPGVDYLVLPGVAKSGTGGYAARSLRLGLEDLAAVRAATLEGALRAFDPDLLVVDKLPLGVADELGPALRLLRDRGETRTVLGLRDVLDEPEIVRREWELTRFEDSVRELYDEIWVYGPREVFDTAAVYGLPDDVRVRFTGYLGHRRALGPHAPPIAGDRPLQLCVVGGGQDGFALAGAFARAPLPPGSRGLVVTGPFMPPRERDALEALCARRDDMAAVDFVSESEPLLTAASNVVAMGGYNTVCELLTHGSRALIVPRVKPRREQAIRAGCLRDLGLVDVLEPDRLSPRAIGDWLGRSPRGRDRRAAAVDLDGLRRIATFTRELLESCASVTS